MELIYQLSAPNSTSAGMNSSSGLYEIRVVQANGGAITAKWCFQNTWHCHGCRKRSMGTIQSPPLYELTHSRWLPCLQSFLISTNLFTFAFPISLLLVNINSLVDKEVWWFWGRSPHTYTICFSPTCFVTCSPCEVATMALRTVHNLLALRASGLTYPMDLRLPLNKPYTRIPNFQRRTINHRSSVSSFPYIYQRRKWQRCREQHPLVWWPKIGCVTYNVDEIASFGPKRMTSVLDHLETACLNDEAFKPMTSLINLQGVTPALLEVLKRQPWVRSNYQMTDIDGADWTEPLNTITLIGRRLTIASVTRVPLVSNKSRTALFIDIQLEHRSIPHPIIIRVCNLDLKSSDPNDVALLSKYLHFPFVHAGIATGDFSVIDGLDDIELPLMNKLKDAHHGNGRTEQGGLTRAIDRTEPKSTRRKRTQCLPSSRLNKIASTGNVLVENPEIIRNDITIGGSADKSFDSCHQGLKTELRFEY